jgi:hypothetical protein
MCHTVSDSVHRRDKSCNFNIANTRGELDFGLVDGVSQSRLHGPIRGALPKCLLRQLDDRSGVFNGIGSLPALPDLICGPSTGIVSRYWSRHISKSISH